MGMEIEISMLNKQLVNLSQFRVDVITQTLGHFQTGECADNLVMVRFTSSIT